MGFVTLEDVQGTIELVLSEDLAKDARTAQGWSDHYRRRQSGYGSAPPKILVDEIRTEIKILESLERAQTAASGAVKPKPEPTPRRSAPSRMPRGKEDPDKAKHPPPIRQIAEKPSRYTPQTEERDGMTFRLARYSR